MLNYENGLKQLFVSGDTTLKEILKIQTEASKNGLPPGIVLLVDENTILQGIITDGDVRRGILKHGHLDIKAKDIANRKPITFKNDMSFTQIIEQIPDRLESTHFEGKKFLSRIILVDEENRPSRLVEYQRLWEQRVATHRHVAIIGMGYVGLTLAIELARSGFYVTGVDVDGGRVRLLKSGVSYVHERGIDELLNEHMGKNFFVSTALPERADVYIVAVGTPVQREEGKKIPEPTLSILEDAASMVAGKLRHGNLVVLRSTVPIGCTRTKVLPILERISGLQGGIDFHLSFAPERTAEGNALEELRSLPQLVGGLNKDSVEATVALFRELTATIVRVESLESAEFAKLINNCFRDFVFSFSNQMSQIASRFNLDIVEVIKAANKGYPRDTVPLPSPGVGGPCLTKDPYILASSIFNKMDDQLLSEHGRRINESMVDFVVSSVCDQLSDLGKNIKDCSVLICGLAFKGHPETGDLRNSVSIEIALKMKSLAGSIYGHDYVARGEEISEFGITPVELPDGARNIDAILFLNNHRKYAALNIFELMRELKSPGVLYDGWHLFEPADVCASCPCVYMGLGMVRSSVDER